jgi:hypothetical protein
VSAREESASPLFRIIAHQLEDMAMFFEALAEPDRGGGPVKPETPEGEEVERRLSREDLADCADEGNRAKKACFEMGGRAEDCYVAAMLVEADRLSAKLKEPQKKG